MIHLDTFPAGEKAHDGGEYGFWTNYAAEDGCVRRAYHTTAGFRYCGGCASFGSIFGPCESCHDDDLDGTIINREEAIREISEETGGRVPKAVIYADLMQEEVIRYWSLEYEAANA